jgi:hypothetical protein
VKFQAREVDVIELMAACARLRKEILGIDHPHSKSPIKVLKGWQVRRQTT